MLMLSMVHCKSQYAEKILNKTGKAINETLAGLKLMPQGFRIYFVSNPRKKAKKLPVT